MQRSVCLLALSIVSSLLGACGSTPPADVDGGAGSPDAAVLRPSRIFGACVEDSQCPGVGAICRRNVDGWPGGFCTVPCTDRTECDDGVIYNHCLTRTGETQAYCEQRCENGADCGRSGFTCTGEFPPSGGLCIGLCGSDEDCGAGASCNGYSGQCVAAGTVPTSGGETGAACGLAEDCLSANCLTRQDNGDGTATVWPGGYCAGPCILPTGWNNNTLFDGETLPAGTCAGDAVCFPSGSLTRGDLGSCLDSCTSNSDCRSGYGCRQSFQLGSGTTVNFSNGICVPAA